MREKVLLACVLLLSSNLVFAQVAVTGTVTDAASKGLGGVTVRILNTNTGTVTDRGGAFTLPSVAKGNYTLETSAVGYATAQQALEVNNDPVTITINLQAATNTLSNVVVTAQKREELLQRTPISVTALSASKVEAYRLWNSRELTAIVPNLFSADPGDRRNVTAIRGIATTSYDPAVATYIDGVNQFNLDTYISPLFDIERIEVLRGPQGTLYGRNAMAGVINIITRQPTNKPSGFAEVNWGNYKTRRYSAGFKVPLIANKLFFGAAGLHERLGGYYTNDFTNSRYDRQQTSMGNYYLKYLPNTKWAATLNVKHNSNRNDGPFPLVFGVAEAFEKPYRLSQNALTKIIDNSLNASLSLNYTGNAFNFSSISAYQKNYRYYNTPIDADFSPLDILTVINNYGRDWNNVRVATQEFKFSSPASSTSLLKWTAGTYLFYQNSPTKQTTRFGEFGQLFGAQDKNFSIINTNTAKSKGAALYGQATYGLFKNVDVTAGLRFDYEHRKQNVLSEFQKDPNPDPVFALRPDTAAATSFSAWQPKLGINWQATANQLLFATYSRGYRAGGLTPITSDPTVPALFPYKPEYSNNIEAGIKNTLINNRLFLNITAFYTTVTDAQVPTLVLPDAVTITRNTGRLTSKGVEAEMSAALAKGFVLDYSFGYTDATFTNLKVAGDSLEVDLKGKRQIFTPDITSMLAAQYNIPLLKKGDVQLLLRGEWRYLGTQYFDLANNIRQAPYSLLHTRFGITSTNVDVLFWGRNLTGKQYIGYAYDFGAVRLGDPETFGVTVKFKM